VLQQFPVTPLTMPMSMSMIGVMYAPTDWTIIVAWQKAWEVW
jgi:hypothetical protein